MMKGTLKQIYETLYYGSILHPNMPDYVEKVLNGLIKSPDCTSLTGRSCSRMGTAARSSTPCATRNGSMTMKGRSTTDRRITSMP